MSILDQIAAAGGRAANFCDVGGGARAESVATALELILSSGEVHALLVSIFGGITRCDEVARGLVAALTQTATTLPVAVRLDGNAAEAGREVLAAAAPAQRDRDRDRPPPPCCMRSRRRRQGRGRAQPRPRWTRRTGSAD